MNAYPFQMLFEKYDTIKVTCFNLKCSYKTIMIPFYLIKQE